MIRLKFLTGAHVRRLAPWAGPGLIVGCVLLVLQAIAFDGRLSTQHVDLLPQWLPNFCFLGKSLTAGHLPAYNPYALSGTPFAADPQSGWTYLPAMLLFTAFSCNRALRWFVVLQPILAGLGIYAFLRSEGVSRVAATVGGLVLAMAMADSSISLSLPFAGTLAWTALLLAATSRLMRAVTWPARAGWVLAAAVAWGQLADAHLSNGALMGTGAVGVYLVARIAAAARTDAWRPVLGAATVLVVALPLVNLAVLLPRVAYVHRSSIGLGYLALRRTSEALRHLPARPFKIGSAGPATWPLGFGIPPGSYLGVVALALSFAGWRLRRHLGLVVGFAAFGAVCFVLSLRAVAEWALPHVLRSGPGQIWLHEPDRFRYAVLLAVAILVGLGAEAWLEASNVRTRIAMLGPGVAVFLILPSVLRLGQGHTAFLVAMAVAGAFVLALAAARPALGLALPLMLAAELLANGFIGHGARSTPSGIGIENGEGFLAWGPLREPDLELAAYLRPEAIATALRQHGSGRYSPVSFQGAHRRRGFLLLQRPVYWSLEANERSMLFHVRDAGGYNPAQLRRYWTFVRAMDPKDRMYNAAFLTLGAQPAAFDLLQVGWVTASLAAPDLPAPVATEGAWGLYPRPTQPPLASASTSWTVARTPEAALDVVRADGFDPGGELVLETPPGIQRPSPGSQTFAVTSQLEGTQAIRVDVWRDGPAVVLVRVPYDTGWHATVDGRPAEVLHADYVDMAVAVPAGTHTIELGYDDPRIGIGLLGSGLSLVAIGGAGLIGALVRRRRRAGTRLRGRSAAVGQSAPDADRDSGADEAR